MSSLKAFNTLLRQFLVELKKLFPQSPAKKYLLAFDTTIKIKPTLWINIFMKNSNPHQEAIITKNEKYFLTTPIKFVDKLKLKDYYPHMTPETKDCCWEYMQGLFLLGINYTNFISKK